MKERIDLWDRPATIERNRFKYKSLSCWSYNIAVGCEHGCTFCYVPEVSTRKLGARLAEYGVKDADAEWGEYLMLRKWDLNSFAASLRRAENTPRSELNADGNRAVMLCTTTDPYQVIRHPDPKRRTELQYAATNLTRFALEEIGAGSTLNVRILTRSPLAARDFNLMKEFGNRLLFGMSLPTLSNKLARIYEPHAPGPSARLTTLRKAKEAGLHVYVAMAPTYPDCDEADLRETLSAIKELEPVTVFHEPINIRADNVARIQKNAVAEGYWLDTSVFETKERWAKYSMDQMLLVEKVALELDLIKRLHLWPDAAMERFYPRRMFEGYWNRISEWPND